MIEKICATAGNIVSQIEWQTGLNSNLQELIDKLWTTLVLTSTNMIVVCRGRSNCLSAIMTILSAIVPIFRQVW